MEEVIIYIPTVKQLFIVDGYIPSDEKIVVINIQKLISFKINNEVKYGWINLIKEGGIGTNTSNFGHNSKEEAFAKVFGFVEECRKVLYTNDIKEVKAAYEQIKETLSDKLLATLNK